jgi:ABC-type uncharacterized transport system permease subunit
MRREIWGCKQVNKYISYFKSGLQVSLKYKFEVYMWVVNSVMQVMLYYFLWRAIFANKATMNGFNLSTMVSYILLATLINNIVPVFHWGDFARLVKTGDIVVELIKPYDLVFKFYFFEIGSKLTSFILTGIPFILIGVFAFNLQGPSSLLHLVYTLVSVFLATLISYLLWCLVGLTGFYTTNVWGVYTMVTGINMFLTGSLVPLEFMPGWLQTIVAWLPFQNIVYTPVSIYLGNIAVPDVPVRLLIQLVWVLIMYVIVRLYYKLGLKRLVVQGG